MLPPARHDRPQLPRAARFRWLPFFILQKYGNFINFNNIYNARIALPSLIDGYTPPYLLYTVLYKRICTCWCVRSRSSSVAGRSLAGAAESEGCARRGAERVPSAAVRGRHCVPAVAARAPADNAPDDRAAARNARRTRLPPRHRHCPQYANYALTSLTFARILLLIRNTTLMPRRYLKTFDID